MVPDFVITGPDFSWKGSGGYACAGFWGNQWQFRPELASCAYLHLMQYTSCVIFMNTSFMYIDDAELGLTTTVFLQLKLSAKWTGCCVLCY